MLTYLLPLVVLLAPKVDTPTGTVRAFVDAVNRAELKKATSYVVGAKYTYPVQRLEGYLRMGSLKVLTVESIGAAVTKKDSATVPVRAAIIGGSMGPETLQLRRSGTRWQIVPPLPKPTQTPPTLGVMVMALSNPVATVAMNAPIVAQASPKAAREADGGMDMFALSNYVLMFAALNGDVFPKDDADLRRGLTSILDNGSPQAKQIAGHFEHLMKLKETRGWRFNPKLAGKPQASVTSPYVTVLFYEDDGGKIGYRHDGKALLSTTIGGVILITPAQEKEYRWTP